MSRWKRTALILLFGGLCLSACGKDEVAQIEMNLPDIEQEIAEYRTNFIELYTSAAMEETESRISIEETEINFGDNGEPATLIKYMDSSGEKLRYQIQFYGETEQCSIDYYLCNDFVLISRKNDYYSSWVLNAGYSDVLYSTIENWIVIDENAYILHSDGELVEIEKTQLDIPMLEEIAKKQEVQNDMFLSGEEYDKITECLNEQVPEIWNEWADYVADRSENKAYIYESIAGDYLPEDVYRDYEKTEYLGKYYLVYVGESWEDHSVNWAWFYISENFDEVLWYDMIQGRDSEYPVLYLDEWRKSDFYPK